MLNGSCVVTVRPPPDRRALPAPRPSGATTRTISRRPFTGEVVRIDPSDKQTIIASGLFLPNRHDHGARWRALCLKCGLWSTSSQFRGDSADYCALVQS